MTEPAGINPYGVEIHDDDGVWTVRIIDPSGAALTARACRNAAEARTYASTVRQHIYWLSPGTFRAYYRLPEA